MKKTGDSEARKAAETLKKYCIEHVYCDGCILIQEMYVKAAYWSIKCRSTG